MKRIEFLKRLLIGLGALVVAPRTLGEVLEASENEATIEGLKSKSEDVRLSFESLGKEAYTFHNHMIHDPTLLNHVSTPTDLKEIGNLTGNLFYKR